MTMYVLGGGVAGLIFAFYNKKFKIITKYIGGQLNLKSFPLGPRFLKANEYSKKLLKDLNIRYNIKKIKVGYYYNKKIHNKIINLKIKKEYFEKSRGTKYVKDKTLMNSGSTEFEVLDININKIINVLKKRLRNRIIEADIIAINLEKKELSLSDKIGLKFLIFNKVISSIPKDVFYKLINCQKDFYSVPITYVLLKGFNLNLQNYDFVYFPEDVFKFHRITKIPNNFFVAELLGIYNDNKLKKIFGKNFIDKIILNNSQIISEKKQENLNNIRFFGRYGTWDRSWKIEKCIEEAIKYETI